MWNPFLCMLHLALGLAAAVTPLPLSDLLDEARKNNPELLALREQAKAAEHSVEPAGALEDPLLTVQLWNAPVDFSAVPLMVQLSQAIPLGGKRAARREAAHAEAARARAMAETKARDLEMALVKTYFEVYLAERTLDVYARLESALRSLRAAASSRVAAGRGEQADALRAQSELLKIQSDGEGIKAKRLSASAQLVALLNRPAGSDISGTTGPGVVEQLPTLHQLNERAARERPEVLVAEAMVRQAEAQVRLARAERVPDLSVFVGEMHSFRTRDVSDFIFTGVQGNLPLWNGSKNEPRIDAAGARLLGAQAEAKALENRIVAEVAHADAQVIAEQRQVELHHQLIPIAGQALSSAMASYVSGKGSFLAVLDSERDLLMHELDLAMHLVSYAQELAELERAVGVDLGLVRASEAGVREEHR